MEGFLQGGVGSTMLLNLSPLLCDHSLPLVPLLPPRAPPSLSCPIPPPRAPPSLPPLLTSIQSLLPQPLLSQAQLREVCCRETQEGGVEGGVGALMLASVLEQLLHGDLGKDAWAIWGGDGIP